MKEKILPDEIREIREALGLAQRAAGELLGGGPSAFAKYESGTIEPAASLVTLLRLLQADPTALDRLRGPAYRPSLHDETPPFEVSASHVAAVDDRMLPALARSLLHAEARDHQLLAPDIHVPSKISVADGGEDGRIQWEGGPSTTATLPGRFIQFQFKAGPVAPTRAAGDILTRTGSLKGMIAAAVGAGAHYVMLCASTYTRTAIERREKAIGDAFATAGRLLDPCRIHFWDAEKIAQWTNRHPAVAVWLKERIEPGTTGPFRSLFHWRDRSEHARSPWIADERLEPLRTRLLTHVDQPQGVFRVLGSAAVGSTRLVLEALLQSPHDGGFRSSLVLYADRAETDLVAINDIVRNLGDIGSRAIVVVDGCPSEAHRRLARLVVKSTSNLSLVTIDTVEDSAEAHSPDTMVIDSAPEAVTAGIIDRALPTLGSEDRRRLLLFTRGYPGIAFAVADAWSRSTPVPYAADKDFVAAFIGGRSLSQNTLRTAKLIAAFGLVYDRAADSHIDEIAARGSLSQAEFRAETATLVDRRVVQRRGGVYALQPRPVSMNLALRQWQEWGPQDWDDVLAGNGDAQLKVNAARQLAWLNTTAVAVQIVEHVCRPGGPFEGLDHLARPGAAQTMFHLAAIYPWLCAELIRNAFDEIRDLDEVGGDLRRNLVETLERIAFDPDAFAEAAELLLRLAEAESEPQISNNATGQFVALFPIILGETAADGKSRIAFLDGIPDTGKQRRAVVVKALLAGIKTSHFSRVRVVGAESHGSRPALVPWRPKTSKQLSEYVLACLDCLAKEAASDDACGLAARDGIAFELRSLVSHGFVDAVESIVAQVLEAVGSWPAAIESLGHFLDFDAADNREPDLSTRVKSLLKALQPKELAERVRYLVTDMPWDYPSGENLDFEARDLRQVSDIQAIATEVSGKPDALLHILPDLTAGRQRWATHFGKHIASRVDSPRRWCERIRQAIICTPEEQRDFTLLAGFLDGLEDPAFVSDAKLGLAASPELAAGLPLVCSTLGIVRTDIDLAIDALEAGLMPPHRLSQWSAGDALRELAPHEVAPLFDALLDRGPETLEVALDLMGMYAHRAKTRLDSLGVQIHKVIDCTVERSLRVGRYHGHPPSADDSQMAAGEGPRQPRRQTGRPSAYARVGDWQVRLYI